MKPAAARRTLMALTFSALEHDLRRQVDGEVRFDAGSRGAYSTDASNYRQVPVGVVVPRTVEAGAETVAVCAGHGVPVVSRGGGTSLAGQACNAAVVIDWSKYCRCDRSSTEAGVRPSITPFLPYERSGVRHRHQWHRDRQSLLRRMTA
jgi:hypothetical protein